MKKKHECEYTSYTGKHQCPTPATIPARIGTKPFIWYCPRHAQIIHCFLKGTPPRTQTQAWHNNHAAIQSRQNAREHRRKRLHHILETIQPASSGQLARYARALDTTPRTIRNDLTHLKKTGLATSEYNHTGNGRTQNWRAKH